jgi:5-methylthioadenosine/S-adenosylhomocysteine deaminase
MQMAALLAKQVAGSAAALPAAQALEMATINGARALGLAGEIGSLVAGKAADVICVDLAGIEHRPLLDPVSQLVYVASRHDVSDVWVAGEHLVAERVALRLDMTEIAAAAGRWGQELRSRG